MENQELVPNQTEASEEQESFAELLEKSTAKATRLAPGVRVKARVIGLSADAVYLDLGGKSEAFINISEFRDENGNITVKEGDEIQAAFAGVEDGARRLTTLINGHSTVKLNVLREAFEQKAPVTGEVKRSIKGGFEVMVNGVRCFCPMSQIDLKAGREGGLYVGSSLPFKIIEFSEDGRTIVLSRRALLQEERNANIARLKEDLVAGAVVTGRVTSIQSFGAFVDLGGVDGLIPMSELSWAKTGRIDEILSLGQEVTVKIISLDWEKKRITLSLKALEPDPWTAVPERYPVGSKVTGAIVRLVPFGAFVSLEPGIDGLIHISNFGTGRRINHPKEVVETGQVVEAYVIAVDPDGKKISLSLQPKKEPRQVSYPAEGEVIDGTIEKVMPFGIFVRIGDGVTGLVPNSEMGTPRGTDHEKMFASGTPMRVLVIGVDTDKGKVTLSRKSVVVREEQETLKKYRETVKEEAKSESGLSAFGELLKSKLESKQ